jgi:hypothetical protein
MKETRENYSLMAPYNNLIIFLKIVAKRFSEM